MPPELQAILIIAAGFVLAYFVAKEFSMLRNFASLIVLAAFMFYGIGRCSEDEGYKARKALEQRDEEAQRLRDQTPRLVSEHDGCKVYAFKGGDRWHYFTRCPNAQVQTDTTQVYRHGKSSVTKIESITTESR